MPRPKNSVPTYRRHKQSGQAIATVRASNGQRKDVLLGEHNSPQSHEAYRRRLAELDQHRGDVVSSAPATLSVNEVLVRFWHHAKVHYRHPDGRPTSEINNYKLSLKPYRELYGMTRERIWAARAQSCAVAFRERRGGLVHPGSQSAYSDLIGGDS